MTWNGSGTFSRKVTTVSPATGTTVISSADMNSSTADFATGINTCLTKDGQNSPTTTLPMATYRHTGVGDATSLTDYASANQVVDNTLQYCGASAVGTDAYAVNATISPGAYVAGNRFQFIADVANTGACTIDISGIGAKNIKLLNGSDPYTNAILANQLVDLEYDGTNLQLLNPGTVAPLAPDSVTATEIATGAVDTDELATDAVTTIKITDANVTLAKMAADSVDASKIVDDSVTTDELDVVDAGTAGQALTSDGDKSMSWLTLPFSSSYASAEQTVTTAGALVLAHGLGSNPSLIQPRIICKVAEYGYSIGDELIINPQGDDTGAGNRGLSVVPDATNISIRYGSVATALGGLNKTTGATVGFTNTSWRLVVRAWA